MLRALWPIAFVACGGGATAPQPVTVTVPAAPVTLQTAPAADGTIGTAHPILVEQAADDGSWLVICQARADTDHDGSIEVGVGMHGHVVGDRMQPYLVFGSGPGAPIDTYVTRSASGAWLAVIRDGKLVVSDAHGTASELRDADVRDDGVPYGEMRAASITSALPSGVLRAPAEPGLANADGGARMTYFRAKQLVIRDLPSGRERALAVGGQPWRAMLDATGRWALVLTLPDGATWPVAETTLAERSCRGAVGSYTSGGWEGDKPAQVWIDLDAATVATPPDAIRDELANGKRPHRVMHHVACTADGGCFDDKGNAIALPHGEVEYGYDDRVLIRDRGKLVVFDASTRKTEPLAAKGDVIDGNRQIVTIGDGLYDLVTRTRVGSASETVVAWAGDRMLLGKSGPPCTPKPGDMPFACVDGVANPAAGGFEQLPLGPLHWAKP